MKGLLLRLGLGGWFCCYSILCFATAIDLNAYLGVWTSKDKSPLVPRIEILDESPKTLYIRFFKACSDDNCIWETASAIPVSIDPYVNPVMNADMITGAFKTETEKVFFDLRMEDKGLIVAKFQISSGKGTKSRKIELRRVSDVTRSMLVSYQTHEDDINSYRGILTRPKGSIYGKAKGSDDLVNNYSIIVYDPVSDRNYFIFPDPRTFIYRLEGLNDGIYYYSVLTEESDLSRFDEEPRESDLAFLIENGETVEINLYLKHNKTPKIKYRGLKTRTQ